MARGIVVDLFAGGGGMSKGIELATGRSVDIAINHDPQAIRMHRANHPETEHYCEDVFQVDPVKAVKGRHVYWLHGSPDCTHHSNARGGKPVDKHIRGLAWVLVDWARAVRPDFISMENVKEFLSWGPLRPDNTPDPERKGETFREFVAALEELGYRCEFKIMLACDFGAPTKRERLIGIFTCTDESIVWPEPTHGDPNSDEVKSGKLLPWRSAAEIIDWSIPVPSIFTRKKPLAQATLDRIGRGLKKFILDHPDPFIAPVSAEIEEDRSELVAAFMTKYHGATSDKDVRGQHLDDPLQTIDTSNRFALVTVNIIKLRNHNTGHAVDEPLHTITAGGTHLGVVCAFIQKYYGQGEGQTCDDSLHTITSKDKFGLVIIKIRGEDYVIVDICMRMLTPRELFNAQGFTPDYIIEHDIDGNPISKKDQVAKCGNSVPPVFGEHIIRSCRPDICAVPIGYTSVLNRKIRQPSIFDDDLQVAI